MNEPRQITSFQMIAIVVNSTIGISVLALPRLASEKVGAGAFLVTFLGVFLSVFGTLILAILSKRFPRDSFITYGQQVISKPVANSISFVLICFFFIITSLVLREFGEVMNTSLLQETPIQATVVSMLLLVAIATRNQILTISYMHTYYLPFIVVPILLMMIFSLQEMDARNIKPFLGNDTSVYDFLHGGITVAGLPFMHIGLFIITSISRYMIEPKKVVKASFYGSSIAAVIILLSVGVTVAVFGSEELGTSLWPMLVLTRMTELPAAILERMDIIFLVVWIISAFTTILSGYLICLVLVSDLCKLRSHRAASYVFAPIFILIALYPDNVVQVYQLIDVIGRWGLVLTIGYPLLLLFVSIIRGKKGVIMDET